MLYHSSHICRRWRFSNLMAVIMGGVILLLCGCIKNEFKVSFNLPDTVNSTYRLSYYASDPRGGIEIETAIAVTSGKGELTGITRNPTLCTISTGLSDIPSAIFYAERGDNIILTGSDPDPLTWTIEGNKLNKILSEWRLSNQDVIKRARDVARGATEREGRRQLNAAVAKFVEQDPSSKAASLILYAYFDAFTDPAEYIRLRELTEKADIPESIRNLLSRQDILTATPPMIVTKNLRLSDIVLTNNYQSVDTIYLTSATPALLYYWTKSDNRYSETIDTLKNLAKWRPDSASMIIADIALTTDSIQWISGLRRDSLKHTVRAIMTSGAADTTAMSHGVGSTPRFIVTAGRGKVVYSGADLAEAAKKFRTLRPKK